MSRDAGYWTVSRGEANRNGYTCRECKRPIYKGKALVSRDGRKVSSTGEGAGTDAQEPTHQHPECFSGEADPRTQKSSSFTDGRLPSSSFQDQAPKEKGSGKWSTSYGYRPDPATVGAASPKASPLKVAGGAQRAAKTSAKTKDPTKATGGG